MAKTNAELAGKIAGNNVKFEQLSVQDQLQKWKDAHFDKLAALAGTREAAEKVFVICMNTIGKNPDLLLCTFESIANCILQSFQLNLFPGPFQECGYVPLRNGKLSDRVGREVKEANFWPQYQGIVKLMRNAGNKSVVARVVCENDHFEYFEGDRSPVYAPAVVMRKKRGAPLFVYAAVQTREGAWQVEVMDLDQIEVIKGRSRGASKSDSPWNSKYDDDRYTMWSKTCLKRVSKWCTKSSELVAAIEYDNAVDGDPSLDRKSILDGLGHGAEGTPPMAPAQEGDHNGAGEPTNGAPAAAPGQPKALPNDQRVALNLKTGDQVAEKVPVQGQQKLQG